ncbi:phosphate acetyltransferase [Ruaniaceae bacterium KH17]|nr:phosphate acetyltransferase [Ruaniaceae bacterium KH17]
MAQSVYLVALEGKTGKSTVALGLLTRLAKTVGKTAVFRPIIQSNENKDAVLTLLQQRTSAGEYDECVGVTYQEFHKDPEAALSTIIEKYRALERKVDTVVVVGSDYTGVSSPIELEFNARIAANLGTAVVLVLNAQVHRSRDIAQTARIAIEEIRSHHAQVVGVVANRVEEETMHRYEQELGLLEVPAWTLPNIPLLASATVGEIMEDLDGELIYGDEELLRREAEDLLIAGMSMHHVLTYLKEGQLVMTPGDRPEMLVGLVAAHASANYPSLSGIVLLGGFDVDSHVDRLLQGFNSKLPIIRTSHDTFTTAKIASNSKGSLTPDSQRKVDLAVATFEKHVPSDAVNTLFDVAPATVMTPLRFEAELLDRARNDRKHIVLPEGDDDRILRAASTLLLREVADLTILGEEGSVRSRAAELGLNLDGARVLSPNNPDLVHQFAEEYARLRAHKGMRVERAVEIVPDVSYFGTMMVHLGLADGMVSGALHTTAHTIKPSFEIIKTKPGVSIVSSSFLMLMEDRVLVYADCAVNPDPTAPQLADIAISSAETAAQFGVEPRIAMLSYSTGTSGSGADVDKVREATEIVRERAPHLSVEGPIQYDAAVDASVAQTKLPGSDVAGRATVFIFPDLNTGNNTYKAVQRSAGAVAVGPVLQGLNKPVNDLSRGALVHDIVNTVAITAVQAQAQATASK